MLRVHYDFSVFIWTVCVRYFAYVIRSRLTSNWNGDYNKKINIF